LKIFRTQNSRASFFNDVTMPVRVLRRFQDGVRSTARRSSNSQSPAPTNVKHLHLADKRDHHRDSRPRFIGRRGKAELGFRTNTRSSPLTRSAPLCTGALPVREIACHATGRPLRDRLVPRQFGPQSIDLRAMRKLWSRKLRPWRVRLLSLNVSMPAGSPAERHERKPLTVSLICAHYRCHSQTERKPSLAMP